MRVPAQRAQILLVTLLEGYCARQSVWYCNPFCGQGGRFGLLSARLIMALCPKAWWLGRMPSMLRSNYMLRHCRGVWFRVVVVKAAGR